MTTFEQAWGKLSEKEYRAEYALALLKRTVAFQIKTLRKKHCGSQEVLAERSELTQGVISRAEDQDYGNLTFNTVGRIAGGLDMAFIGRFVPFTDLVKYAHDLSESTLEDIPTFEEENEKLKLSEGAHLSAFGNARSQLPTFLPTFTYLVFVDESGKAFKKPPASVLTDGAAQLAFGR